MAAVDSGDPRHDDCRRLLEDHRGPLLVPMLVITEVTYLLQREAGSLVELRFIADLIEGTHEAMSVEQTDWVRIAELGLKYRDLPLGTVDASVIALAERLKIRRSRRSITDTSRSFVRLTSRRSSCCPERIRLAAVTPHLAQGRVRSQDLFFELTGHSLRA